MLVHSLLISLLVGYFPIIAGFSSSTENIDRASVKKTFEASSIKEPEVFAVERGSINSQNYSIFYYDKNGPISPFHDIPLFANESQKIFNMIIEIPRWTNAKMEISTEEPLNPIKQGVRNGKLRYIANVFPHHGCIWNYGALPQTWENPNHLDEFTGKGGDNDPIDACEIGFRVAKRGSVIQVKILGVIAVIDKGETDWKLLVIDVNDPLAPQLNDISDVEQHMPGFLKFAVEWLRIFKIPTGKPVNQFAFNGEPQDREFALKILLGTHNEWRALVDGRSDPGKIDASSVTSSFASKKITVEEAKKIVENTTEPSPAVPIDPKVNLWHFVN